MKYSTQCAIEAVLHILLGLLGIFVLCLSLIAGATWAKVVSGIFTIAGVLTLMAAGIAAGAVLIGKAVFYFLD